MKYFTLVSIVLIITLLTVSILAPGWANVIAGVVVFFGLSMVLYAVVRKHIRQRQSQPVSKLKTAVNIFVEITGILLVMIVAGLLGRYVAEVSTRPIDHELTKLITGIVIGMVSGLGVGFLVRRTWGRLVGIGS